MSHELLLLGGQAKDIIAKRGPDLDVILLTMEGAIGEDCAEERHLLTGLKALDNGPGGALDNLLIKL